MTAAGWRLHPRQMRHALATWPSGVAVVAALVDGAPLGITVNSFTSVSLDPALVSVSLHRGSRTWLRLRDVGRLGVSILARDQERIGRTLATVGADRFGTVAWTATDHGAVVVDGAVAWLEVSIHRLIDAGDHELALLAVHGIEADHDRMPLVFHASAFTTVAAASAGPG